MTRVKHGHSEKRTHSLERTKLQVTKKEREEDNLQRDDKGHGPEVSSLWRFYCT